MDHTILRCERGKAERQVNCIEEAVTRCHFHVGDGMYNIAFTGDMKFERTWLFNATVNKFPRLETLVIESTYRGYHDIQPSRTDAANQLKSIVERTLQNRGKLVVPVFAVGRSQEVMLVLEELIRTGKIEKLPIYLDGMIWEATAIHTADPEYLNSQLRTQIFQMGENPFLSEIFKRVDSSEMRERICNDPEPCVVLATSGMMNGGPVMEYFKAWRMDAAARHFRKKRQALGTEHALAKTLERLLAGVERLPADWPVQRGYADGCTCHSLGLIGFVWTGDRIESGLRAARLLQLYLPDWRLQRHLCPNSPDRAARYQ